MFLTAEGVFLAAFLYPADYQDLLQGGIQKKSRICTGCTGINFVQNVLCKNAENLI